MVNSHIKIQWLGVRKDSGRGAVWGWFTEVGKREEPLPRWAHGEGNPEPKAHMFYGRIGKELHILEFDLTDGFIEMMKGYQNNYKTAEAEKVMARWGKRFEEDLSMYLLMLKMKG